MKFFIRLTSPSKLYLMIFFIVAMVSLVPFRQTSATDTAKVPTTFYQNGLMFYDPNECDSSSSGESCGNTAKEIYWTALSNAFGTVQAAGILGNIINEGGFNPVSVESCTGNNPFNFKTKTWADGWSAEEYINGTKTTGVGSFGITYQRHKYFDFIEEKNGHDLIEKYFTHPEEYSFGGCGLSAGSSQTGGDALIQKIGKADFNRLVSLEIEYMQQMLKDAGFNVDEFNKLETPEKAAEYFSMNYEKCANGCLTKGSAENQERGRAAKKVYDEMKDYVCSGGTFSGKGYNYSEEQLKRLTAAAKSENSCNIDAIKDELSVMANITEERGYDSIIDFIQVAPKNGGFFATKTGAAYYTNDYKNVTDEEYQAAIEVIKNGQRTMPKGINEHDCLGDDIGIDFDGTGNFESFSSWGPCQGSAQEVSISRFKSGITKIRNKYDSEYTFYAFAGDDTKCDPFGYTKEIETGGMVSSGTSSGGSSSGGSSGDSSGSVSKSIPSKITLIGDSISVMSENAIKEKFPDSFLNMVGSRHASSGGVCPGDEGGIDILKKIMSTSGSIAAQHADSSCETVILNASALNNDIVWELGTNPNGVWDYSHNQPSRTNIDKVVSSIGNGRTLYLVTPYDGSSEESKNRTNAIASMYQGVASENDNVKIIDWNAAVKNNESKYLNDDRTHPNAEGQKLFADLLSKITTSSNVCVGSITSSNFEWYNQCDEPWGNVSFGNSTICSAGCGPTSFAMMASILLGHTITPEETAKVTVDASALCDGGRCGSGANMTRILAEHFGLEYDETPRPSTVQEIVNVINGYLQDGWMVHISGMGSDPFPLKVGHYIGIIGFNDEGKWLIVNSSAHEEARNKAYDPVALISAGQHYSIKAIRGAGNNTSNCIGLCDTEGESTSSGGLTAGGLDKAKADALMEEYRNSNEEELINLGWIGRTSCKGGSLSNCVAFTQYFINKYTTKSVTGLPNGSDVVGRLIQLGFKDGGTTPRPYAVFSTESGVTKCGDKLCGHTGVVLSIDTANNKIVVGEAGCSSAASWTGAHEYALDKFSSGAYTYAYTDDFLKGL